MAPYETQQEPSCHSPPLSQRRKFVVGGSRCRLHVHHVMDIVAALILVAQLCWAPVDALVVLQN
jgi:hypothetical protein